MALTNVVRWMGMMGLLCGGMLLWMGQASQPGVAGTGAKLTHFQRNQMELRGLWIGQKGVGYLVGQNAVYAMAGNALHWKAEDTLVGTSWRGVAGGDGDVVYLMAYGEVNSRTQKLRRWSRATGKLEDLGLIPEYGACRFIDGQRGACIGMVPEFARSYPDVQVTVDGGKSWKRNPDVLGKEETLIRVVWLSTQRLLVAGHGGVGSFSVDDTGALKREWLAKLNVDSLVDMAGRDDAIWIKTGREAVAMEAATGNVTAKVEVGIQVNVVAAMGKDLWMAGDENAAVYRVGGTEKWELVKKFGYPGEPSAFRGDGARLTPVPPQGFVKWIVADATGAAVLVGVDGQTYRWDGQAEVLTAGALERDNGAVDAAAAAAQAKEPTPEQFREMMALMKAVPAPRLGDVLAASKEKQAAEGWTDRQKVAWMIAEMQRIAKEEGAGAASKPANTGTGDFGTHIFGVRFFSKDFGFAVTGCGVLTTNGSADRWMGRTGWSKPQASSVIVGGSEKAVYLVATDSRTVVVKEGYDPPKGRERDSRLHRETRRGKEVLTEDVFAHTLWRWTAAEGLVELRKLPGREKFDQSWPAACAFFSDRVGAVVEGGKLLLTRDGCKTWMESTLKLDAAYEHVRQIEFCGANRIALTTGNEAVGLLEIEKDGVTRQLWRTPIFGRLGYGWPHAPALAYAPANKLLWVYSESAAGSGSKLQAFGLTDGKVVREFSPFGTDENLSSFSVNEGAIWTVGSEKFGGMVLRFWDVKKEKPEKTGQIQVASYARNVSSAAFRVPGTNDVYLIQNSQRVIQWDGKPEVPVFDTSKTRRPWVELGVLEGMEYQWPPGEFANRRERAALQEAQKGLTTPQVLQISKELEGKRADFENYREQVLWMTKRALELKAGGAATVPATRGAGN